MPGKPYKQNKRGDGRHVQLLEWLQASEAWSALKPGPRALYIELKRRYTGGNNGSLHMSHREAAAALNVGRDTAAGYFLSLIETGFIVMTRGHCLGPSGVGQSAHYRLTEMPSADGPATKEFMSWKKQNPRRKIRHPMAGKSNTLCRKTRHSEIQMSENPTGFGQKRPSTVSENPAIYTYSHIPHSKVEANTRLKSGHGLCGLARKEAA
ncbi:hypothetical protein [uncultured Roseovarius sp.]|uniref:hypothetical protein n=1 Tax=uncultured Roseovarius sp. TaxID=293344 RepID=UPI0026143F8C|nr:hypothetical protein [uncultured Roseovarius sp.]